MPARRRCRREESGEPCVGIGSLAVGEACSGRREIVRWRFGWWAEEEVGEELGEVGEGGARVLGYVDGGIDAVGGCVD
jgi:hypothetical protein